MIQRITALRILPRRLAMVAGLMGATMLAGHADAQSRQVPAPPQTKPVLIHSVTVHTLTKDLPLSNGYVRFDDGVITVIGSGTPPASATRGAELIDAEGLHLWPGLIAAKTTVGLQETGAVPVTLDHTELGNLKPEVRAAVAVNPDSELIPVARANGILTACMFPGGGLISGRCSVMRLDGWTWEDMAINPTAGLVVSWPNTEPISAWWMRTSVEQQRKRIAESLREVEEYFDRAQAYLTAREHDSATQIDLRYEGMRDALAGEQPIFIIANSAGQIESAVAWGARRGFNVVIVGGAEADQVTPVLLKHDVPVIIDGLHRLPTRRHYDPNQPFEVPNRLFEAGVRFCIASGAEPGHERDLNHNAATAAAYGLPVFEAQRAVTANAAEILGIGDTHGTIEKGKAATLILTTGDPLEIRTDTLEAFVDGRRIDLGSKHKMLYAKYLQKYKQLGLIDD